MSNASFRAKLGEEEKKHVLLVLDNAPLLYPSSEAFRYLDITLQMAWFVLVTADNANKASEYLQAPHTPHEEVDLVIGDVTELQKAFPEIARKYDLVHMETSPRGIMKAGIASRKQDAETNPDLQPNTTEFSVEDNGMDFCSKIAQLASNLYPDRSRGSGIASF